jgi:hypothetical protein
VPRRLLVIDVNISPPIADHLRARGRNAISAHHVPLPGVEDVSKLTDNELLSKLATFYQDHDWILVTDDDQMPLEHHEACVLLKLTIATVDGRFRVWKPQFKTQEHWRYDVIHRFADKMEDQEPSTFRRYGMTNRPWTPRLFVQDAKRRHQRYAPSVSRTPKKATKAGQVADSDTLF